MGLLCACDGQAWESHLRRVLLHRSTSSGSRTSSAGSSGGQLAVFSCSITQLERDLNADVMPSIADADLQVTLCSEPTGQTFSS